MEIEESTVPKSKGRTSRSNSSSSKDLKAQKANVKETNGVLGNNISDLPNGNEGLPISMIKTENNSFEIEEHHPEENDSANIEPSPQTERLQPPEDSNSHSMNKNRTEDLPVKMEVSASSDDEDFRGFEPREAKSYEERDKPIFEKIFNKAEKQIKKYETAIKAELRKENFSSGTSTPVKIDGLTEAMGGDGDLCSSNASSPSVASGFSGELRSFRGKKSFHTDLSSPAYRKPLDMGWKRELVYRHTPDATQRRMADVYYYTPTGKKVRSAREVVEHLAGTDLTDENFTFFKRAIGLNDPNKEIIRDAKRITLKVTTMAPKPVAQASPARSKAQGRPKKDTMPLAEGELEMGMLPPSWKEPSAVSGAHKTTTSAASSSVWAGTIKEEHSTGAPPESALMRYFMQNLSAGYTALQLVFQYLKVHELLRAARVCRMWYDLAGHSSLWKTVRMKNSQVLDWDGCAETLSRHSTRHLDLRKMLQDQSKSKEIWAKFCEAIGRIPSLRHLDLCRCPASVVERVAARCPQLTNLNAVTITDFNIDLKALVPLTQLKDLRLKGSSGLRVRSSLEVLKTMTTLRHLSLTTVKDLGKSTPEILKTLTQLVSLELGECSDLPETFGSECLPCLTHLTRLRLELGQGKCPTFVILSGVKSLPSLTHLELVNFDIKPGFDQSLAQCKNIKRLLLIPTYLTQSATTNHMVLGGVTKLSKSLTQFVWGVTHELLHVTELFKDQCEGQKGGSLKNAPNAQAAIMNPPLPVGKKGSVGDSIPILRPVPGMEGLGPAIEIKTEENESSKPSPQVDILPISQIHKILVSQLPDTKINILKIAFHSTWRQTLTDH